MFKRTKQPDFIVSHRLHGVNAKRDPLLDEKLGSNKRSRVEDGSASVIYKETPDEKRARLNAERQAEKELKEAQKGRKIGLGPSKASILGLPEPEEGEPAGEETTPAARVPLSNKEAKSTLASFRERLKGSSLPEQAAASETRHKAELEAETAKAMAANEEKKSGAAKASAPDSDERLTMNEIWKAGEGHACNHMFRNAMPSCRLLVCKWFSLAAILDAAIM